MAKLEFTYQREDDPDFPPSIETIEVRVWDVAGLESQVFYMGSGLNFQASGNYWIEILYSVGGAQIFYTRSFLHHTLGPENTEGYLKQLDILQQDGKGSFGFGDMMPETGISLKAEQNSYHNDETGEDHTYTNCHFEIFADTGAVFGHTAPGERFIKIVIPFIRLEDGVAFMRDLVRELDAVQRGSHPNPASLPEGSSEWPFVWQLNCKAYDALSDDYQESYFENPLLAESFDRFLAQLPAGGQVLDAGCGHGDPVIGRLLEGGFIVTGTDFSPKMLARARRQFPQASFFHETTTQLDFDPTFDGACSFSSLLYFDPIDLYHSLYQLHCALKPGGLLFLYAYDLGPSWRGDAHYPWMKHWMWSWHYAMDEAAARLEEHGFFEVIEKRRVAVNEEKENEVDAWYEQQRLKREATEREDQLNNQLPQLDFPPDRPSYGYLIVARNKAG